MAKIADGVLHTFTTGEKIDADQAPSGGALNPIFEIIREAVNNTDGRVDELVQALVGVDANRGVFQTKVEVFTATEGQTAFTLTKGTYTVGGDRLQVYVGTAIQTVEGGNFAETSSTVFTLSEGIPAGTSVIAVWVEGLLISAEVAVHGSRHEAGGADELDVLKLKNGDQIGNLSGDLGGRGINVKYPPAPLVAAIGDGTTADTTAIQNIINSVGQNGGGIVLFPSGVYITTATLNMIYDNVHLIGNEAEIRQTFSGACFTFGKSDYSQTIEHCVIDGLTLNGGYAPDSVENGAIVVYRGLYNKFKDLQITTFNKASTSYGIKIIGGKSVNNAYFSATNVIDTCSIGVTKNGVIFDDCVQNTIIIGGHIIGNFGDRSNYAYALNIKDANSQGNLLIGTDIEDYNTGIRINGTQSQFIRPRIENCLTKFVQDTNGGQNAIMAEWGLGSVSDITNNGGQLKASTLGYDFLSQLVKVLSPSSSTAAEFDIVGGSASNAIMQFFRGTTKTLEVSNVPNGNDIRFFANQADNLMHEVFGFRADGFIAKMYTKGSLTFDNALNSGDVPNNTLFRHDATGKLSFKDNSGVVNALY